MDDHKLWGTIWTGWGLGMLALMLWRGRFRMPLHGWIERKSDPLSFWVIFAFCCLIVALFGGVAIFGS